MKGCILHWRHSFLFENVVLHLNVGLYNTSMENSILQILHGSYRSWKTCKVLVFFFIVAFSRTGKSLKKVYGPGTFWKSVKLK